MIYCTGPSAGWCPIHGDCICPMDESGEYVTAEGFFGRNHPDCPLHSPDSPHGEGIYAEDDQVIHTLWGDM